ncbi:nSTAND1 domain-containing NTPase [Enhygromyxa salina]|uniref:WD domain, G-beta repeat n=1 Tax=Enhygromyxa salina TaxID=215803 RepID=A0A2S9XNP7_9BACT|nr:SIR2 family protein [Enhygromyxa salina]PRP94311.1 WD domain, G-beta repeat [Enhygromyxa salina]
MTEHELDPARPRASPTIPPELLDAHERAELIICVGPELARGAGLPSRSELALALLTDVEQRGRTIDAATIREWIADGRVDEALEALERRGGSRFARVIERELGERGRPLPPLARVIARLEPNLRAVYTTGIDRLLERAFADAWPSFSSAQADLARRRKVIVKLCGTLEFPETWALTRAALEREFGERSLRRQLLVATCRAHCVLFVGFDPADSLTERVFATIDRSDADAQLPSHFVVLNHCGSETQALLERRGLHVLLADPVSLLQALRGADPQRDTSAHAQLPVCPYPGLQAFDHSLASVFHGRRAEISAAASRLGGPEGRHRRWLAIDGSSGVGKSSFAHAGVVPALLRGFAEGTPSRWRVASLHPGRRPLPALVEALVVALAGDPNRSGERLPCDWIEAGDAPSSVTEFVREYLPPGAALLVVVDQLEELVTLASASERARFAACLTLLLDQQLIYLITTLRSDFTASVSTTMPALARLLNEQAQRHTLAPISRVGLRAAIAEPSAQLGVRFEGELVERIASDAEQHLARRSVDADGVVRTDDAALPLVAHVLRKLWDMHADDEREIGLADYEALGGVSGALSLSADALLASLGAEQVARVKALLLRMVNLDDSRLTRRALSRLEAVTLAGGGEHGERLLQLLCGGAGPRLIVVRSENDETRVEFVHEALLREWDRLREWIAADQAQLARDEALRRRAAGWRKQGRPWRSLPRGLERRELLAGRALGPSAAEQRDYQRAMRSAGWIRVAGWVGFSASLAGVGYLGVEELRAADAVAQRQQTEIADALDETQKTRTERDHAKAKNTESHLRAGIQGLLDEHRCHQALDRVTRELPDDRALLRRAVRCEAIVGELARLDDSHGATSLAVDPTSQTAWFGTTEGAADRWNLKTHQLQTITTLGQGLHAIEVAPGGERVALASSGQVRLIDSDGEPVAAPFNATQPVFSPDGELLATKHGQYRIEVRESADGALVWWQPTEGKIETFEFSSQGDRLCVGSSARVGSTITTLDSETGDPVGATIEVNDFLRDIAVSPDGLRVASTADDRFTRLWSLASGELLSELAFSLREPKHSSVSFSPRGGFLVTTSTDERAAITTPNLEPLREAKPVAPQVRPQFSPGEQWLLTAGFDEHSSLRAVRTGAEVVRLDLGAQPRAQTLFVAPGSQHRGDIVAVTQTGGVLHWAIDTREHWRAPTPHAQGVRSLAFSSGDPRRVLSGSSAGTVLAWTIGADDQIPPTTISGWVVGLGTADEGARSLAVADNGALISWTETAPAPTVLATGCPSKIVAIDGPSQRLAIACGGGGGQLWDLSPPSPRLMAEITSELGVSSIALAGDQLALGGSDGTIELFRYRVTHAGRRSLTRDRAIRGHDGAVKGLSFDFSGQLLVSGGNDNLAQLWAADESPRRLLDLPVSGHNVESVAITRDATLLAAGDAQGTIVIWDRQGVEQERFESGCVGRRVYALAFSPDDQLLAAGCSDGSVHAWPIGTEALLELACARLANTTRHPETLPPTCRPNR